MFNTKARILPLAAATLIFLSQSSAALAAPTWKPKFDPNKTVYVDPLMAGHPTAPYNFSPNLQAQLSKESNEGLRYFVVAAQQGDEPAPPDKPLGVAKVDELLPTWTNHPNFPKENYVVIYWVRKKADLNKGSVGVNAGSVGRDLGVTPDMLSDPDGLVIPSLRSNMPADPEKAMTDIVSNIEGQVNSYRTILAQRQETLEAERRSMAARQEQRRIAAIKRDEQMAQFKQDIQSLFQFILNALPFAGGAGTVGFIIISRRRRKSMAQSLIDEWSSLSKKVSSLYLKIEEEELPKIKTLPLDSDPVLKAKFDEFNIDLAILMSWLSAANTQLDQARSFMDSGDSRKTINALTQMKTVVRNDPSSLAEHSCQEVTTTELKENLDNLSKSIEVTLRELLGIQGSYLELSKENAFPALMSRPQNVLDPHISEFNRYGLSQGSFVDSSHAFNDFVEEYEQLIIKSEVEFKALRIADSVATLHKSTEKLDLLNTKVEQALVDKQNCERDAEQVFSGDEIEASIALAQSALEDVKSKFPKEYSRGYTVKINQTALTKDRDLLRFKDSFVSSYQEKQFTDAYKDMQSAKSLKGKLMQALAGIIEYPIRLQEKKESLERKLSEAVRINNSLRGWYQVDIESLAWQSLTLDDLDSRISNIESSVSAARSKQRRDSQSSSSSFSVGSSFGSSSGGSDFGGFSGGGDFGSGSGGGDY